MKKIIVTLAALFIFTLTKVNTAATTQTRTPMSQALGSIFLATGLISLGYTIALKQWKRYILVREMALINQIRPLGQSQSYCSLSISKTDMPVAEAGYNCATKLNLTDESVEDNVWKQEARLKTTEGKHLTNQSNKLDSKISWGWASSLTTLALGALLISSKTPLKI